MCRSTMPWAGLVTAADWAVYDPAFGSPDRPIRVGISPAILVVDMTRNAVDSAYPAGFGKTGWPAVAATGRLLEVARGQGLPVYYTKAYADPAYRPRRVELGRWRVDGNVRTDPKLPPGDVVVDELTPHPDDVVICKGDKPSAFFGTRLASYLHLDAVDTLVIAGMTTSGCVRASALDAFQHNFHVLIPFECVADRSELSHKVNLFDLHMKYADVVGLVEAIAYVRGIPPRDSPMRL